MFTTANLLADQRARMLSTAVAEHARPADLHGDQARGIDPDAIHDAAREDSL